jgi:hypothetical protein
MQGPPQQSEAEPQASPATRQNGNSWQVATLPTPSPSATQSWPQQSALVAQASPAGRQPGSIAAQTPDMQAPSQQSPLVAQPPPAGAQAGSPQMPFRQPSEQQSLGRAQGCWSDAHPTGLRQMRLPSPAGSIPQRNVQQSASRRQAVPSA